MTATMTDSTKASVRRLFNDRCVLCLGITPTQHVAHILNSSAEIGALQVTVGTGFRLLRTVPDRRAASNGFVQCPTCHLSYLTSTSTLPPVCFIPCEAILRYIDWYLSPNNPQHTYGTVQDIVEDLATNPSAEAASARPFRDMFQLRVQGPMNSNYEIETRHMPPTVYLADNAFVAHPMDSSNPAFQIFDATQLPRTAPRNSGHISIYPVNTRSNTGATLLWRLPGRSAASFLTFIAATYISTGATPQGDVLQLYCEQIFNRLRQFNLPSATFYRPQNDGHQSNNTHSEDKIDPVAPPPEPTAREVENTEHWTYGPEFSSNSAIALATGITVPKPWFQHRPPPGEPVPLSVPSPFAYPGAPAGNLAFLQSEGTDADDA